MAVYVDDKKARYQKNNYRIYILCHMMADSMPELHKMADRIGINRKYFQGDHYDICRTKRLLAVKLGAIEVTSRELVNLRRLQRKE